MNKSKFLKTVCKQIHFGWDRDIVSRELENHIEDSILDLIQEGYSKEEAEKIAIEQMGDPIVIGKQLNKEHKPLLGWIWIISNVIVVLLIVPSLFYSQVAGHEVYKYFWPINTTTKENTIVIYETFDFEAHTVTIDKLLKKNDSYCLTYRAMAKLDVNRTGVTDYLFHVTDEKGNILDEYKGLIYPINTFLGCQGEKWFEIPKNEIIYLSFTNGEVIKLDVKEYLYE